VLTYHVLTYEGAVALFSRDSLLGLKVREHLIKTVQRAFCLPDALWTLPTMTVV
jgi:hypothetical protein